jgi:hypothetical protein
MQLGQRCFIMMVDGDSRSTMTPGERSMSFGVLAFVGVVRTRVLRSLPHCSRLTSATVTSSSGRTKRKTVDRSVGSPIVREIASHGIRVVRADSSSRAPFVSSFGYAVPVAPYRRLRDAGGIGPALDLVPELLIRDENDLPSLSV